MSSSGEDDGERYDVSPSLKSSFETFEHTQPSTYLLEDSTPTPPVLMPKRSSGFNRTSAFLDMQTPIATPVAAPRRLSSNTKQNDNFMKVSFNKPHNETRPNLKTIPQTHFSKSLDLTEIHNFPNEVFNLQLSGQSESNLDNGSSTEQLPAALSKSWPSPKTILSGGLKNTEFENLSTTNTDLLNQTAMPVPVVRPVPKPRTRTKIPPQSLNSSCFSKTVQNEMKEQSSTRHSQPMIALHSQFSTHADTRQLNYSYITEHNHDAVKLTQNDEIYKKSGFTEFISDINHTDSTNGDNDITCDDDDESNYVKPDNISNNLSLFVSQGIKQLCKSPASPRPHSITHTPPYVEMIDKRQTQNPASSPSPLPSSLHRQPEVYNLEQKINLGIDIFDESTTDIFTVPEDSTKGFDLNSTHNSTTQRPFNDIQPFKSNISINSHTFDKEELETKQNQNVKNSGSDFLLSEMSKSVEFPSKPVQFPSTPVQSPSKPVQSPPTPFQPPSKPVQSPPTPFQSPLTPVQSPPTPLQSPPPPVQSPSKPVQSPPTPLQSPLTPVQSPLTPLQSPLTPVQPPSKPLQSPLTPVQSSSTPVQFPLKPVRSPSRQVQFPSTPVQFPSKPVPSPLTPVQSPSRQVQFPSTPVQFPSKPVEYPSTPVQPPSTPVQPPLTQVQSPSKPVRSPSNDSIGEPVESNLSSPGSDFSVDWESAFAKPVTPDASNFLISGPYNSTEETNGTHEASFSPRTQKATNSASSLKSQNHEQPFIHEAPRSRPPPLPTQQNHFPDQAPHPLPIRPNNTSNLYSQTDFQASPVKTNAICTSAPNKDIFGELPTPAFSQNQSNDPFQDSNFGIECQQFNTNKVTPPPYRYPLRKAPIAKAGVPSRDMVDTKATIDQNKDPESLSRCVIPSPNSKELGSSDSENPELATSETSNQELDNGCGGRRTRLKVFDSSLLPRKNARCGYLSKQGGYKANKGWKKRWVVYNGTNLSYFCSSTANVSKRIIPVRCMVSVETDVKATDKNSFRFKVITSLKDRVFIFSSETLDDCLTWANTLMAAITEYKKSVKLSDQLLEKPDIEGFIKFGNMKKYYVTVTGKTLCYYHSFEDYQMGSPTHEIEMKLASIKVKDHRKLQLWIYYGHFNLTFETDQEMQQWRLAMEDAIAEGLADDTVLRKVYENMSNQHCADCGIENPHWASVNLGIVICKNCAGIHRMFDYRISKIRSLRMDTRVWTPSLVELMVTIGNANANAFWEYELPAVAKIQPTEPTDKRKEFIFTKYKSKKFCKLHPLANQGPVLGEVLLDAASHDNVLEMIKVLFSGANVLYRKEEHGPTAYDVAKEHGQRLIMELLYQNGGDPQTSEQDVTDENRLREDVRLQGYLNKTGPVGRNFEKRWCILEHGALTYYLNEKSKTFRGSIHRKDMYLIHVTESDRIGYSFELSTGLKEARIFTFSSDSRDDSGEWIRTIGKLMAPVAVMDQVGMIDVKLAGYAFMKESLVDEWHQTFLVFSWRSIHYMNRDLKFEYLDLRKASGIKMQDSSNSYQQRGPCFVISSTGKSVYLQAMLTRDTEKMYTAFLEAVVSSGPTLIDQALTNENVPVIVEKCITHIYMNGLEERGIYRVAGQNSHVQALLDEFRKDVWSVCLTAYTVQDVSNALKRFLRELDDSVFGRINYVTWINKAGCKDMNNRLMWYKYYLEKMPVVNFQTLKRIILHLVQVSQHENVNLMSINNLASCFAPSLMRTAKDDPTLASDAAGKEISIMVDLLNNCDYFFNVNDDERIILNNIRWAEKEIQKRIQENRTSVVDPATAGILIPVHLLSREGQSVNILVTEEKTAKEAMEYLKRNKTAPDLGSYVLHEQLFRGALERPLFPEDIISKTTNRWMEWESWVMEDNNVCLCVRGLELLEKLSTHFSPNHTLLSKHQYCDSKPKSRFKRRVIGFRQCKLALYSDSQGNSELISWRVEDITIYLGSVPRKTLPPYRYCLTFTVNGEKYTKPSFGYCISFETENELCRWTAALYAAQHPAGLLSWAKE